jgi:hypothetical protein
MKRIATITLLAIATLSTGCAGFNQAMARAAAEHRAEEARKQAIWASYTPAQRQSVRREQCRKQYEGTINPTNYLGAMAIANDTVAQKFDRREDAKMALQLCVERAADQS